MVGNLAEKLELKQVGKLVASWDLKLGWKRVELCVALRVVMLVVE